VTTYDTPDELRVAVEYSIGDPKVATSVDAARALVVEHHSFDRRADTVLQLVRRYGLLADA
jgi:hypothetical protein